MHVLGILGSPRIDGNTDLLLEEALRGARASGASAGKVVLNELRIAPCQECETVRRDGTCAVRDDMERVYALVSEADAVIFASPIFFGSVSAQMKAMVDRFQCAWLARHRFGREVFQKQRVCAFIAAAASGRRDFFENAAAVIRNICATVRGRYAEELFCPGVEEKGSVRGRPDCMGEAYELGRRLIVGR